MYLDPVLKKTLHGFDLVVSHIDTNQLLPLLGFVWKRRQSVVCHTEFAQLKVMGGVCV
jgi:hypothetical protein